MAGCHLQAGLGSWLAGSDNLVQAIQLELIELPCGRHVRARLGQSYQPVSESN